MFEIMLEIIFESIFENNFENNFEYIFGFPECVGQRALGSKNAPFSLNNAVVHVQHLWKTILKIISKNNFEKQFRT